MPRWPEHDGLQVRRLCGFACDAAEVSDDRAATFTLTFDAAPPGPGEEVVLAFDGIATVFEVVLNGTVVLTGDSMFAAHVVDAGGLLREQGNVMEIRCRALNAVLAEAPRRPRQRWRTKVVADGALRFVRTAVLGRAPGFSPGPPIVGPWRPVWLVRRRGVTVEDVALRPRTDGDDGVLAVRAQLRGVAGAPLPARVEAVVGGEHRATLSIAADGTASGDVRVPGAERWWPHTHGAPALYDVALELHAGGGEQEAATGGTVAVGRTGFRTLTPGPEFDVDRDALALAVNGVGVFARGAVWTPVATDEVGATLAAMCDAGMNLVRVPGIGVYEDAAFHDCCDELGLLVWQDFMFANLDYPIADDSFRTAVEAEARGALAQVAGRPSLAVLCGNSEVEQQAAMFGAGAGGRGELFGELLPRLAREAGAEVPYVPSAPSGGTLPFHPGHGVANYFGVGGYRRPLADARTSAVRFAAECLAFANLPDGAVADGEGVARDVGAGWDFADVRDHYLRERYGVDPGALRSADRERYLALGRQVTGEVMAAVLGEWRRGASPTAGAIVLWLRDQHRGAGWGLLDHRGAPKVALGHVRRALAPQALWLVDEGLGGVDVHVANDGPAPLRAELHVALLAAGTHAIAEGAGPVAVDPHGAVVINVEGLLGRFADAAYAYRFGAPAHDAVVATLRTADGAVLRQATHFPTGPPLEPASWPLTALARGPASAPRVEVQTERLAWGVRIQAPGFAAADDGFVVAPGAPQTVVLRPLTPDAGWAGGTVTALNLIGETPIDGPFVAA
jgi:beta-mannosidase